MRFIVVIVVVVCGLAAAAPATPAKPPAKKDRYLVWVEAAVFDSSRSHRVTVEGGCTKTSSHGHTQKLAFRSGGPSMLVATRTGKTRFLGGKLRPLVGTLNAEGGGSHTDSCLLYGVISDLLTSPIQIYDGSLDVRADLGKPVTFSNLRGIFLPGGTERPADDFVTAFGRAPAALTAEQLYEAKFNEVAVVGSYHVATPSADGAEWRSMSVTWKLTIRAIPRKGEMASE